MSAGNGWAAAGMLRVLGTLQSSAFSQDFSNEINDLCDWVAEVHSAMYPHQVRFVRNTPNVYSLFVNCTASQWSVQELRRRQQ